MKKITTLILIMAILIVLLLAACVDNDKRGNNEGGNVERTPIPEGFELNSSSANATATFGAGQFNLQLTAIANDGQ